MGSWDSKRTLERNKGNLNISWTSVNDKDTGSLIVTNVSCYWKMLLIGKSSWG